MDYKINTTTDVISSTGGIALVGKIFEKIGFGIKSLTTKIKHPEILKSLAGIFVQGRIHFEELRLFKDDLLFQESLELNYVPAPETARLYLEQMIEEQSHVNKYIETANIQLLQSATILPTQIEGRAYIPVDVDTSPMDNSKSNKEGVSRTYKNFDGYHPIFCYIGMEGYILNCELREGKQHCQKGTPDFLTRTLKISAQLNVEDPLLFRLDSGNDSQDTIRVLAESGHFFIIKRNLRKELPTYWLDIARAEGEITIQNERKTVYTGTHTGRKPANNDDLPSMDITFKVTERKIAKNETVLLFPEIEVETFWTNLYENPGEVIELYHAHGTSEQFHSELKSDMNVERLPSGKFAVNAMLLQIAMIAFNTLRFIGQTAIKFKKDLPYKTNVIRKRLRKVIDDLIRIACKIVTHARGTYIKLWDKDPWLECFKKIYLTCCNL